MQIQPGNSKARDIANKVMREVDGEKQRLANMQGSKYDSAAHSDSVELKGVARGPIGRLIEGTGMIPEGMEPSRWTAQARLEQPNSSSIKEMSSKVESEHSMLDSSRTESYGYKEADGVKTYTRETDREKRTGGYLMHTQKDAVTVTVDRSGNLFMEDQHLRSGI